MAGAEVNMTRTALRRRPPPSRARERSILLMRFYRNMTQAEIGARLGLSQMHVSGLQAAALRYLRGRLLSQDPTASVPGGARGTSLTQTRRQS
jgi:RNA polymerase sigma-B factor